MTITAGSSQHTFLEGGSESEAPQDAEDGPSGEYETGQYYSETDPFNRPGSSDIQDGRLVLAGYPRSLQSSPLPPLSIGTAQYGPQWEWDAQKRDYTRLEGGKLLLYTEYQRSGGKSRPIDSPAAGTGTFITSPSSSQLGYPPPRRSPGTRVHDQEAGESISHASIGATSSQPNLEDRFAKFHIVPPGPGPGPSASDHGQGGQMFKPLQQPQTSIPASLAPPKPKKAWEEQLDERFRIVDKPRRFFSVGRIFKTIWFEPGGQDTPARRQDIEWTRACPPFFQERPYAKFRWFVVVRKRLHHSLCFSITTFGGRGATKPSRGRAKDFVVLFSSSIEAPKPFDEEQITRDPIAVIIEDGDQFISPLARLDCGRIYTVEDNLRVMKIGRVHPESLDNLENYYKESVL